MTHWFPCPQSNLCSASGLVYESNSFRSMCDGEGRLGEKGINSIVINSYKPGIPFVGHRQNSIAPDVTPQNAASHLGLFCLHREISS